MQAEIYASQNIGSTEPDGDASQMERLVTQAYQQAEVTPQPFRSETPIIGPLIVWFRRLWNQVATRWFVLPMVEQQNAYNRTLLQALEESNREREQLAVMMVEYVRESAREIGELTDEARRWQAETVAEDTTDRPAGR